ncbi:MAG: OmpH family outer membrane protein [Gammaproteobacteria bacterium]|nr:OmpH family outer membrane protein [Gammaproteobacteria bacterium]MBU1656458.1 OmpH family outer membrane protein [Gammaproteobacteria bacterium]MBU1962255.1 OmpH family outer membrane protein [Gammaproteobacteria bacterium]
MNKNLILSLAIASLSFTGCQGQMPPPPAPTNIVAVFDINRITEEAGLMSAVQEKAKTKQEELVQELTKYKASLLEELKQQVEKIDSLDGSRDQKVAELQRAVEIQLIKAQRQADVALNTHRAGVIGELRDLFKPIAREVARAKGFKIVLLKNDAVVFDFVDELDLTDEIMASYRAKHPEAAQKPESATQEKAEVLAPKEPDFAPVQGKANDGEPAPKN